MRLVDTWPPSSPSPALFGVMAAPRRGRGGLAALRDLSTVRSRHIQAQGHQFDGRLRSGGYLSDDAPTAPTPSPSRPTGLRVHLHSNLAEARLAFKSGPDLQSGRSRRPAHDQQGPGRAAAGIVGVAASTPRPLAKAGSAASGWSCRWGRETPESTCSVPMVRCWRRALGMSAGPAELEAVSGTARRQVPGLHLTRGSDRTSIDRLQKAASNLFPWTQPSPALSLGFCSRLGLRVCAETRSRWWNIGPADASTRSRPMPWCGSLSIRPGGDTAMTLPTLTRAAGSRHWRRLRRRDRIAPVSEIRNKSGGSSSPSSSPPQRRMMPWSKMKGQSTAHLPATCKDPG